MLLDIACVRLIIKTRLSRGNCSGGDKELNRDLFIWFRRAQLCIIFYGHFYFANMNIAAQNN